MKKLNHQKLSSKIAKLLAHPPLSAESLTGRGFSLFQRLLFGGKNNSKKWAFTLAEVLITLTIIGVIAALTIPNLMQKYQEEALKTAYKKAYSVLNNAYKMVIAENGIIDCYYYQIGNSRYRGQNRVDCLNLQDKLFGNALKVAKKCDNHALQNGCLPNGGYKDPTEAAIETGSTEEDANTRFGAGSCPSLRKNKIENNFSAIVLNDGQIIFYLKSVDHCFMFVDTNGKKGPNKWGYDVFEFDVWKGKSGDPVITYGETTCVVKEKGGKTPLEMYKSTILNY